MEVLIVEDEHFASEKLKKMILDLDENIQIIDIITNIKDAVRFLKNNKVDLIFLDIQLEDGISFEIFNRIDISTPVIFTTAYDKFAIKAFELNSISYLLKPIKKPNLEKAIQKFKSLSKSDFDINVIKDLFEKKDYKKRFLINVGMKIRTINTEDIAYFFAQDKTVYLVTFNSDKYDIDLTLDSLDKQLSPDDFFRINRKFIINLRAINNMFSLSRSRIKIELNPKLKNDLEAIVSIEKSSDFKDWLNK
jgi:two-component system response regulator LytT